MGKQRKVYYLRHMLKASRLSISKLILQEKIKRKHDQTENKMLGYEILGTDVEYQLFQISN